MHSHHLLKVLGLVLFPGNFRNLQLYMAGWKVGGTQCNVSMMNWGSLTCRLSICPAFKSRAAWTLSIMYNNNKVMGIFYRWLTIGPHTVRLLWRLQGGLQSIASYKIHFEFRQSIFGGSFLSFVWQHYFLLSLLLASHGLFVSLSPKTITWKGK